MGYQYQKNNITDRLSELDDESFAEVADNMATHAAKVEKPALDGIVHISELDAEIDQIYDEEGKFLGTSTGYETLDEKMGGLEPGSVVLIGGETSNGKSMLALNIAINIASTMENILYISLEMTRKQVLRRMMKMLQGEFVINEDLDFTIQKSHSIGYKDLSKLVTRAKKENDCKVVFLDYLQYLGRGMSEKEVAIMSKEVKQIALEEDICFVVIVSLRKAGGDEKTKRKWTAIETEDLMGTAALGYDADTAIITSRKNQDNQFVGDKFFVKVLKTRNTELSFDDRIVEMNWNKMRISDDPENAAKAEARMKQKRAEEGFTVAG